MIFYLVLLMSFYINDLKSVCTQNLNLSMMIELHFFLELQIKQTKEIFF